jgi:hypothetical protein
MTRKRNRNFVVKQFNIRGSARLASPVHRWLPVERARIDADERGTR